MTDRESSDVTTPAAPLAVRGVSRCAVAGLALAGAAWAVRGIWQIRLATTGEPASGPPDQGGGNHRPLTGLEDGYHLVSTVGDVATVLCAVAFLSWLLRMRENASAVSGRKPRWSWIWVYAGWVVPIANLFVPRGVVADVHRSMAPDAPLPRAVNWWWGLWLVGTFTGVGLMYTGTTDEVIARAYTGVGPLLVADAAVVGAAVACALMIRSLNAASAVR